MPKGFSYIILAKQSRVREKFPKPPSAPALDMSSSFADSVTWTWARYFLKSNDRPCRAPSPGAADTKSCGLTLTWEPGPGQKKPAESP